MTKKQYLKALGNKLRFHVTSEEYRDIMSDMEECFEAGAAEGRTEEDIAARLGSPAAAAKELYSGQKIKADPLVRTSICIFIMLILHFVILKTEWELFVPLIFLPPLFLMICELPRSPLRSITEYPADIMPLISAVLLPVSGILLQSFFRYAFTAQMHKYAGISVILFITVALLSNILLLISCIKSNKTAESVFSAGVSIFTAITLLRMGAVMVKYPEYQNVIGSLGIAKALFAVLLLASFLSVLCSVSGKSAFAAAALYPPLFTVIFTDRLWLTASRIDPADTRSSDFFGTISYEYYLTGGMICTAAVLAAILIIRRNRGKENG